MPGDPPAAWLMPLIGDAVIGITALWVAGWLARKTGVWVWTTVVVWNALAIWDALSAFIVHKSVPWPDFFMVATFGSSMFFAASAMHLAILIMACRKNTREILIRA